MSEFFGRLSEEQDTHARNIGARLAMRALADGRLPKWPDDLDMSDRIAIFPRGTAPAAVDQAIEAAGAGFFEALDDAIQPDPAMEIVWEDEDGTPWRVDFRTWRIVPRATRAAMDEYLLVLLDDAAARHGWNAGQFLAAYAALAGRRNVGGCLARG